MPRPLTEPMWGKVGEKWGLMADLRQSPAKSGPRLRSEVLAAALVVGPSSARGGTSGRPGARETLPPASTTSPNSAELHASVPILKSRTVFPQENVAQVTSPNEFW